MGLDDNDKIKILRMAFTDPKMLDIMVAGMDEKAISQRAGELIAQDPELSKKLAKYVVTQDRTETSESRR